MNPAVTTDATEPASAAGAEELPQPRSFYDVPGWFYNTDVVLFDWFLQRQQWLEQRGDLLEMGAYLGRSAIMMHAYLRAEETFTVCDLFGSEAPTEHNEREMRGSYSTLTRRSFEANFLSFHDELPRVLHAPTSVVPDEVTAGSCRFVHVDASHLYEHVHPDISAARDALTGDGLVVLDDYRSSHTPGVACATWQAVLDGGLRPVCVSNQKFYGTWGDPTAVQDELHEALSERGDCWLQWQEVAGQRLLLIGGRKATAPRLPVSRHEKSRAGARGGEQDGAGVRGGEQDGAGVRGGKQDGAGVRGGKQDGAGAGAASGRRSPSLSRRVAREVLPPVVARHLARALRARGR